MEKFLHYYDRFLIILEKIIQIFMVISIILMVSCVVVGIIFRNINNSLVWINELAQFSCIWAVYIGFGLCVKHKLLAGVDIIQGILPPSGKKIMSVTQDVLIIFFLVVFLWSSYPLMNLLITTGRLSPEMRVPVFYGYLGPVLGSAFALLFAIYVFIQDLGFGQKAQEEGDLWAT